MKKVGSVLVVGLDPNREEMPAELVRTYQGDGNSDESDRMYRLLVDFYHSIINATTPYVVAYKPNIELFERYGPAGVRALETVIRYVVSRELLVIINAKVDDCDPSTQAAANTFIGEVPSTFFLVPFDTQGGDTDDAVSAADYNGFGVIVSTHAICNQLDPGGAAKTARQTLNSALMRAGKGCGVFWDLPDECC